MAKIDPTGITGTTLPEYVQQFGEAFRTALGSDLDLDAQTPQGQIIGIISQAASNLDDIIVQQFAVLDVDQAAGTQLDAIANNFLIFREDSTAAKVNCEIVGVEETFIPKGSKVATSLGDVLLCSQDVTIPSAGKITVAFEAETKGVLSIKPGDVTTIVTKISGWDSVNNTEAGVAGTAPQSDTDFRQKYFNLLSKNARSSNDATKAAIFEASAKTSVPVIDVVVTDNDSPDELTTQGVTLNGHSLYCVVQGGNNTKTAEAIEKTKPPGCATQGNTEVLVPTNGGRLQKNIRFQTAALVDIFLIVEIVVLDAQLVDPQGRVQTALVEYVNSLLIAQTIYKSLLYCPITSVTGLVVKNLELSKTKGGTDADYIEPLLFERLILNAENVEVRIVT